MELEPFVNRFGGETPSQRRLGVALRRVLLAALDPSFDDASRNRLATRLDDLVVDAPLAESRYSDDEASSWYVGDATVMNRRGNHPVLGTGSATGLDGSWDTTDDEVFLRLRFDARHEGQPRTAHGGWVAMVFDIMLAQSARRTGQGGPTGTLSVRFDHPVPTNESLTFRSWVEGVERRKVMVGADLVEADGTRLAIASGIFVRPRPQ